MLKANNITFFENQAYLRKWFEANYKESKEIWIGYYRKGTGKPSITWKESVDEALCFGWIDGIRKKVDDESFTIRFTPRNPKSVWSKINSERIMELKKLKMVTAIGWDLFQKRDKIKSEQYSFEQRNTIKIPSGYLKTFKKNKKAWDFFSSQPPWYKKTAFWWIVSAKQETTRSRRLNQLIDDSENLRTIPPLTRKKNTVS